MSEIDDYSAWVRRVYVAIINAKAGAMQIDMAAPDARDAIISIAESIHTARHHQRSPIAGTVSTADPTDLREWPNLPGEFLTAHEAILNTAERLEIWLREAAGYPELEDVSPQIKAEMMRRNIVDILGDVAPVDSLQDMFEKLRRERLTLSAPNRGDAIPKLGTEGQQPSETIPAEVVKPVLSEPSFPPDDGWHFRAGEVWFRGGRHDWPTKDQSTILELLVRAPSAKSIADISAAIDPNDDNSTLYESTKAQISKLRKWLCVEFALPAGSDPVPSAGHGTKSYKFDHSLFLSPTKDLPTGN